MQKELKNILLPILFAGALCAMCTACRKTEDYPVTPVITFKSFESRNYIDAAGVRIDSVMYLTISYTDGDGDIGIPQDDTDPPFNAGSPYYYNLVVKYFKKTNGMFVEKILPLPYSTRIADITPEGNHKAIKGDIKLQMSAIDPQAHFDTVRCEVYLYDRALHQSNVITTSPLVINHTDK